MKKIHYKYILGSILSLLSILIIYFLYKSVTEISNLKGLTNITAKETEEILSKTITIPKYMIRFIFTLIILLTNAALGAWILSRKVKGLDKAFAISLIIFGGIGIPAIIYLVKLSLNKKTSKINSIGSPLIKAGGIVSVGTLVVTPIALIACAANMKGVDNPTHGTPIVFSDKNTNLIELFTDGFDARAMRELLDSNHDENTENLDDFYGLENFLTPGFITNDSIPAEFSNDYKEINPFMAHLEVEQTNYNESPTSYEYKKWFTKFAMQKVNGIPYHNSKIMSKTINANTYNRHIVNPTSLSDTFSYMPHVSGNPEYLSKNYDLDKNNKNTKNKVQIVNWAQAKNENAGNFGVSPLNVDGQFYKWTEEHSTLGHSTPGNEVKGEYLWMQDSLTHTPWNGGKNNSLEWNSTYNKYQKVVDNINQLVSHLKSINAYDNTMIVIYGDHADHGRTTLIDTDMSKDTKTVRGNRSFAMIKYPNTSSTHKPFEMINDKAYSAPEFNNMILDAFEGSKDADTYLHSAQFNINRNFRIYDGASKTALTHLVKVANPNKEHPFTYEEIINDNGTPNLWTTYEGMKSKYKDSKWDRNDVNWDNLRKDIEGLAV